MNLSPSQEWKQAKLGQVAKIERKSVQPTDIVTGTTYIGLEHIDGEGMFKGVHSVDAGEIASNKFIFDSRHLLYGKLRPYLKKIARPNFSGVCSTDILPILPGTHLDKNFLHYYLRQPKYIELATKRSTGANLPRLSPKTLEEFPVFLPPLEEQKRIAAILDKADAIRRKRKKAIALTEELLRSTFLDMFGDPVTNPKGWEKVSLGELIPQKGQIVDGPFGSSLKPECYVADGVRVVRNFNIQDDFFDESEFVYVTEEKFSEIKRSNVKCGDLLLSTKGTIGNVCIMPKLEGKSALSASGTVRIRFPETSKVLPEFAVQQMVQKNYKQYIKWFEAGTNQKYLNLSGIRKMELIVPPLELQQKFLNLRTKNYSLKSKSNSIFVETGNLFNSLLQKAFRGEL